MIANQLASRSKKINTNYLPLNNQVINTITKNFEKLISEKPVWKASLFDEYFFTTKLLPMIQNSQKTKTKIDVKIVTKAWAQQLNNNNQRIQTLRVELQPIVEKLLVNLI